MAIRWPPLQCNIHALNTILSFDKDEQGFTLTEILVVVIIAGVLAAIAAPGWLTFMNRQRVSSANKEVLQMLRDAQTQAIAKRTTYGVLLEPNDNDPDKSPAITQFTAKGKDKTDADERIELYTENLGGGTGGNGLVLETEPNNPANQYRFRFDGSVDQDTIAQANRFTDDSNAREYVYKIVVSKEGTKRCVIVETLLGAMREGSDDECNA